jgi:hypothetical protein
MAMARHQALLAEQQQQQQQRMFQQQQQLALGSGSAGKHSNMTYHVKIPQSLCDYVYQVPFCMAAN